VIDQGEVPSVGGKPNRRGAADVARCAGDQRNLRHDVASDASRSPAGSNK
jgi:hypothetical protein